MKRTWRFTDVEFIVLWEQLREDTLPAPFTFLSRTPDYDDYLREKREARAHLDRTVGHSADEIFDMVAGPDIRIVLRGIDGRNPGNPGGSIRVLGVRRGERAYVLEQLAGETVQHSAGFVITECEVLALAETIAAKLPKADPGKRPYISLPMPVRPEDEVGDAFNRTVVRGAFDELDTYDGTRFLETVPTAAGWITVRQGFSRFGPRGRVIRHLEWRDLADDGRYLITAHRPPAATAADTGRLTAAINTEIAAVVRAIKDERA
ncbi:ESX secretion-associated protein EspG [Nocardia sp. NPDC052566]|uniref:ESX secretion-associated protein EspG n=1 Tax=Nocardia sp. NPDC052566 TaxID=3364330 RepID=UPI0037CAD0EC